MTLIRKMPWLRVVALLGAVAFAGCGPAEVPSGTVSGTVNLDDKPLESGEITFFSSSGASASGPIKDGQFSLEGSLPVGEYNVSIGPAQLTEAPGEGGDKVAAPTTSVPAAYQTPATSGITQKIEKGENTVTIDLKASGPSVAP